jgi:hypothetical protein
MKHVCVDILSPSQLVPRDELEHVTKVLERQVNEHVAPAWSVTADVRLIGPRSEPRKDAWRLVLLDEHDPDGDDGYHELTRGGHPQGLVLLREAMQCKTGWTSTASHELLEMLVNPDTQLSVFVYDDDVGGRVYSCEICDPCQDDPFCYELDRVWLSDFVLPAWFEPWTVHDKPAFDHAGKLEKPFKVAPGGYMSFYEARKRKWIDDYGSYDAQRLEPILGYASRAARGTSRRRLREVPRDKWRKSTR